MLKATSMKNRNLVSFVVLCICFVTNTTRVSSNESSISSIALYPRGTCHCRGL